MERFIIDEHGRRTAVILDMEDDKALVQAAEDAGEIHAVDDALRQIESGDDEMIDYREARDGWQHTRQADKREPERWATGFASRATSRSKSATSSLEINPASTQRS